MRNVVSALNFKFLHSTFIGCDKNVHRVRYRLSFLIDFRDDWQGNNSTSLSRSIKWVAVRVSKATGFKAPATRAATMTKLNVEDARNNLRREVLRPSTFANIPRIEKSYNGRLSAKLLFSAEPVHAQPPNLRRL